MEYNKTKKLPIGVGKKIVEALKKQPQLFENEYENTNEIKGRTTNKEVFSVINNYEQTQLSPSYKNQERWNKTADFNEDEEYLSEETFYKYSSIDNDDELNYEESEELYSPSEEDYAISDKYNKLKNKRQEYENYQFLDEENNYQDKSFKAYPTQTVRKKQKPPVEATDNVKKEFSSNIETLTKLIHQLPSGVTRQTGAQIIRQTMEAIGMSMNKVLTEAQQAQENHAQKIKEHLNSIEEYKNNIRILEKELQRNKKRVDDLDDIISLFILTERDKKK